jgi:hypothetical protein
MKYLLLFGSALLLSILFLCYPPTRVQAKRVSSDKLYPDSKDVLKKQISDTLRASELLLKKAKQTNHKIQQQLNKIKQDARNCE